jgi:hypothetical protein
MTPDPTSAAARAIQPPPSNVAVLLHSTTEPSHHQPAASSATLEVVTPELVHAAGSLMVKRRSVRLAARPTGSVDPMACAHDTKIKKLGLTEEVEDVKVVKKRQLLKAYTSVASDITKATVQDLLGIHAQAVYYAVLVLLVIVSLAN